jgi:hypothetical protein
MTESELAKIISAAVKLGMQRVEQRVESRLKALEDRGMAVTYTGVYEQGKGYRVGQLCTKSGDLWLCTADTILPPAAHPAGWKLIVKSGQA